LKAEYTYVRKGSYEMSIGQICRGRVVKVPQSTPLSEVARVMSVEHLGAVIVTDGSHQQAPLAGIITDRDIVNAQLEQAKDLASLSAGEAMTKHVLTLTRDESIDGAIAHMRARNVRRAPVVSADGVPVGLVSVDDLIGQLSFDLFEIASMVARQPQREQ
jgi:CBS domain-containing protein